MMNTPFVNIVNIFKTLKSIKLIKTQCYLGKFQCIKVQAVFMPSPEEFQHLELFLEKRKNSVIAKFFKDVKGKALKKPLKLIIQWKNLEDERIEFSSIAGAIFLYIIKIVTTIHVVASYNKPAATGIYSVANSNYVLSYKMVVWFKCFSFEQKKLANCRNCKRRKSCLFLSKAN